MLPRIYSLAALIAIWALAAALAQSRLLPGPLAIGATILADIRSGELPYQIGCTLARVIGSFAIAMVLGIIAGYAMGRSRTVDRYADPWLVVLLNMPALVTIIFAYVWIGLNETAAILAVAANKLPNVVVVMREGARALDPDFDEMAKAFKFTCFLQNSPRRDPATCAISGGQFALRPVDRLEDRAGGRVDRAPEWRGIRAGFGILVVRHGQNTELCDLLHRTYAGDRKSFGATA